MSKHNEACCRIPPIITNDYSHKGNYIELDSLKTYVTGPSSATVALLSVYDIFGFFPQTIQGADILACSDLSQQYQVFMPDFFDGNPAQITWYPPDTEEKQQKLGAWFQNAQPDLYLARVGAVLDAAQKYNPNIKSWGIIGYCWGGKMASRLAGQDSLFKAVVQTSPAMLDADDASKVTVPMMVLASKEESTEDVQKYEAALKGTKHIEVFRDQIHGFMSARSNLADVSVKSGYERGYELALSFFRNQIR